MQIHQQRGERANLQRFIDCSLFGRPLALGENLAIQGLWRTALHHPSNRKLEPGENVRLITSGWAGWVRVADRGRQLIFLFLMPGDYIVPELFNVHDCDLISLTPMRTVDASPLAENGSTITPQSSAMIHRSRQRYRHLMLNHMTRLMIGSTKASVASLLIEFYERSVRSGNCTEGRFSFPIGQRRLASALGRSAVQVNKVISSFQADGLIRVGYNWIEIVDLERLQSLSGITPPGKAAREAEAMALPIEAVGLEAAF